MPFPIPDVIMGLYIGRFPKMKDQTRVQNVVENAIFPVYNTALKFSQQ